MLSLLIIRNHDRPDLCAAVCAGVNYKSGDILWFIKPPPADYPVFNKVVQHTGDLDMANAGCVELKDTAFRYVVAIKPIFEGEEIVLYDPDYDKSNY